MYGSMKAAGLPIVLRLFLQNHRLMKCLIDTFQQAVHVHNHNQLGKMKTKLTHISKYNKGLHGGSKNLLSYCLGKYIKKKGTNIEHKQIRESHRSEKTI